MKSNLRNVVFGLLNYQCMHNYNFLKGKSTTYQKRGNFINGHCITFFKKFIMCHEPQTRGLMAVETL
jgi:hypothetical protein